jgi:hypothetical protein
VLHSVPIINAKAAIRVTGFSPRRSFQDSTFANLDNPHWPRLGVSGRLRFARRRPGRFIPAVPLEAEDQARREPYIFGMPARLSRKVNPVGLKDPEPNVPVNPCIRAATKHHGETAE